VRADVYLVSGGYVQSRQQAKRMIEESCVVIDGVTVKKVAQEIADGAHEVVLHELCPYVGRGGLKLEAALDAFGISSLEKNALDIGASTGGFTDCLLRRGVRKVYAVDSGSDQLASALKNDPRVCSMERCNARYLVRESIPDVIDLVVMDVSFISATYLIPRFRDFLRRGGDAVCLIKPQFEVGRAMLGKGGIVKDKRAHRLAVDKVLQSGRESGLVPVGLIVSPITGGDGNKEFLVHFVCGENGADELTEAKIASVTR
jgi:23S rRNA (cytidine1920-2'-O)/16S rRNA (cytidine1409-2'-O)-methyltransferase